jgi:hypothetical protein
MRGAGIAAADDPGRDQLRVGAQGRPGPNIPVAERSELVRWHVLLLRVAEGPNLVGLDALAREVDQHAVLVLGARSPEIHQEFGHRVDRNVGHLGRRPEAVPLDQHPEDLGTLGGRRSVHVW